MGITSQPEAGSYRRSKVSTKEIIFINSPLITKEISFINSTFFTRMSLYVGTSQPHTGSHKRKVNTTYICMYRELYFISFFDTRRRVHDVGMMYVSAGHGAMQEEGQQKKRGFMNLFYLLILRSTTTVYLEDRAAGALELGQYSPGKGKAEEGQRHHEVADVDV